MKLPKNFGGQGFGGMMENMKGAMARAQNLEAELATMRIESETGPIKVVFDGTGLLQKISIDKSIIDPEDSEMLEDMVLSAVRAGFEKSVEIRATKTKEITDGLPDFPGLKF